MRLVIEQDSLIYEGDYDDTGRIETVTMPFEYESKQALLDELSVRAVAFMEAVGEYSVKQLAMQKTFGKDTKSYAYRKAKGELKVLSDNLVSIGLSTISSGLSVIPLQPYVNFAERKLDLSMLRVLTLDEWFVKAGL